MKRKMWSIYLVISVVSAMFMCACTKQNEMSERTEWVKKSIEQWNQTTRIQVNSTSEKTLGDGSGKMQAEKIAVDKKEKQIYHSVVIQSDLDGRKEYVEYYGVEDGKSYQITFDSEKYVKQVIGEENRLKSYFELAPVKITEKTEIEVLGTDVIDEKEYIKVKFVIPDFQRIQEKDETKQLYEIAKKSTTYRKELREAEEMYADYKEEAVVWFDRNLHPVKSESDRTIHDKFIDTIMKAYFDTMEIEAEENAIIEKSVLRREYLTGEQCDKIEMPTEYEEDEDR